MTNDLEKTFFDTFGIEQKEKVNQTFNGAEFKVETIKEYPQITDRILLELICIIHQADLDLHGEEYYFESLNYKDLKEEVIAKCKRLADKNAFSEATGEHIKHQVRTLFEEG